MGFNKDPILIQLILAYPYAMGGAYMFQEAFNWTNTRLVQDESSIQVFK